jgi:hypothetical protein
MGAKLTRARAARQALLEELGAPAPVTEALAAALARKTRAVKALKGIR